MTLDELLGPRHLIAILRRLDAKRALQIADAVWTADAGLVEIPVQSPAALAVLKAVAAEARHRGQPVGAGTITSADLLHAAALAGASFTVAPGLDAEVVRASSAIGLPHLPGVATGTEVQAALRLGCTWVKAFPAASLGASWFREMRGPFPEVAFVATGGVSNDNAKDFLRAGARALGVGSAISTPQGLDAILTLARSASASWGSLDD
jgi:2-dehydro-3-deoxyphosphogluconate aldolase/(4S)-4-hydroxy-2-oxoglutarate aldolase